jgi:predicted metalloendopeptidase
MLTLRVRALLATSLCLATLCVASGAQPSGILLENMDPAVRPQDNFYRYVNGTWLAKAQIPADLPAWGSYWTLRDQIQGQLREIIEVAAKDTAAAPDSETARIGRLYESFMDEGRLEQLGARPLATELTRIQAVKDKAALAGLMAHLQQLGVTAPIDGGVSVDSRDSSRYVVEIGQSGLGLPDRDYYLRDDDAKLSKIRGQYQAYIAASLARLGDRNAAAEAASIVALEKDLARAQWTKVENRDPVKTYNKVELAKLAALAPQFDWHGYLAGAGVAAKIDSVIVDQPSYLTGFGKTLAHTSLPVWKSYFRWHLLRHYAPYLSRDYVDAHSGFYRTALYGVPDNSPRWKRGVGLVDGALGEALGKLYVARYFPPSSKARIEALVHNLLEAYRQDVAGLDWMGPETRAQALTKLSKITVKLGYPDKWRDYSALTLAADDLVGNVMRADQFEYDYNVNKLGRPVDRSEWGMTPQTINAYYNPQFNEIVFPAAFLQPVEFNPDADDAVNYGAIGQTIGHEISHGFDDEGSQFDGDGNLRDWWTAEDHARFAAKTRALVAEYSAFEPIKGYHINGELTLGENIADNSGIAIAYKAYRLSLQGKPAPVIDGLTGDQRFFLAYAQMWRGTAREDYIRQLTLSNPHSYRSFRVNGVVRNIDAWYAAFAVQLGDKLYLAPAQRARIW